MGLNNPQTRKIGVFSLLALMIQAGLSLCLTITDSLFMVHVGADFLPYIYMAMPGVMLLYVPIYSYLIRRIGASQVFHITLWVILAGAFAIYLFLSRAYPGLGLKGRVIALFCIKLYAGLWWVGLYSITWNFMDEHFHILEAKISYPYIAAASALGSALGGGLVSVLAGKVGSANIFLIWVACSLISLLIYYYIASTQGERTGEDLDPTEEAGLFSNFKEIIGAIKGSSFTKAFVMASFSLLITMSICEFQFMNLMQQGRTEAEMARLLGNLYAAVNIFNISATLFIFPWLIKGLGVANMALIQPAVFLFSFSYMFLSYGFYAAVIQFFSYQGVMPSIEYNNQNLLINGFPSRYRSRIRLLIEGLSEPLSTAVGGLILVMVIRRLDPESLALVGLGFSLLSMACAMRVRALYPRAMRHNLRMEWVDFSSYPSIRLDEQGDLKELFFRLVMSCEDRVKDVLIPLMKSYPQQIAQWVVEALCKLGFKPGLEDILATLIADERSRWGSLKAMLEKSGGQPPCIKVIWDSVKLNSSKGQGPQDSELSSQLDRMYLLPVQELNRKLRQIRQIGRQMVPRLLPLLWDRRVGYQAKVLAIRGLGAVAPIYLQELFPQLARSFLDRAYRYIITGRALSQYDRDSLWQLLAQFYLEKQQEQTDLFLELLSASGKVPEISLLKSNLNSVDPRERAYSLEAIGQGCGPALFKRVLPLLTGEARHQEGRPGVDLEGAVLGLFDTKDPLEIYYGTYMAFCFGIVPRAELELMVVDSLRGMEDLDVSKQVVAELWSLFKQGLECWRGVILQSLLVMGNSHILGFLSPKKRMVFGLGGEIQHRGPWNPIFKFGQPVEGFWILFNGNVEITSPGEAGRLVASPAVLGQECLAFRSSYQESCISKGSELLFFKKQCLDRVISIWPEVAIGLYRSRFGGMVT